MIVPFNKTRSFSTDFEGFRALLLYVKDGIQRRKWRLFFLPSPLLFSNGFRPMPRIPRGQVA
jgi:hypothetical protein